MGERTPPKTDGFWISFRRWPVRSDPSEMRNRHIPLSAAAFGLKCAVVCFFHVLRLAEPHRHLPLSAASARFDNRQNGRPAYAHISQAQRQRGWEQVNATFRVACALYRSRGTQNGKEQRAERGGSLETAGSKQSFWSLLGLWPKVTRVGARNASPRQNLTTNRIFFQENYGTYIKTARGVCNESHFHLRRHRGTR